MIMQSPEYIVHVLGIGEDAYRTLIYQFFCNVFMDEYDPCGCEGK
jgi:hypothetical protein